MNALWLGRSLKEHWEEWLRELLFGRESGVLWVATADQKKAIKSWILAEKGGAMGWDILTREEKERREGTWGEWEIKTWGMSKTEDWVGVVGWAAEAVAFARAGYSLEEVFGGGPWGNLTRMLLSELQKNKIRGCWEVVPEADVAAGFADCAAWEVRATPVVGLLTSEATTAAAISAMEALEKTHGEKRMCGLADGEKVERTRVATPSQIKPALEEILSAGACKRIVWSGEAAKANLVGWGFGRGKPWWEEEFFENWRAAILQEGALAEFDFVATKVARALVAEEKLKKALEEAKEAWGQRGEWRRFQEEVMKLPATGTWEVFEGLSKEMFPDRTLRLAQKSGALRRVLVGSLSKELWLEMLSSVGDREALCYEAVEALPLDRAWGLVDAETLVVWTDKTLPQAVISTSAELATKLNRENYKEGSAPQKGWLAIDNQRLLQDLEAVAVECASVVRLKDETQAGKDWQEVLYLELLATGDERLLKKHACRNDEKQPFGENDYALETPFNASAKQWEEVLASPEIAWYELSKLRPLELEQGVGLERLWVGLWVHEAMKELEKEAPAEFFRKRDCPAAGLRWKQARAKAQKIATAFERALKGVKTLAVEKELRGAWLGVKISGRLDRIVELPGGEKVIVDFKTGSAGKLSEEGLVEGDGLQLLLYARLEGEGFSLCRLSPDGKPSAQVWVGEEIFESEKQVEKIAQTGILGQRAAVFGRFGQEHRLPIAAWPVDFQMQERRARR